PKTPVKTNPKKNLRIHANRFLDLPNELCLNARGRRLRNLLYGPQRDSASGASSSAFSAGSPSLQKNRTMVLFSGEKRAMWDEAVWQYKPQYFSFPAFFSVFLPNKKSDFSDNAV